MTEHLDVVVVGAGLSGVAAGFHLQDKLPGLSYAILEGRERMGGTWDLFRYPGVRSDSDMYTLGYPFRPWIGDKSITSGESILDYIETTAAAFRIDEKIRYRRRVIAAAWDSASALWTLTVRRGQGKDEEERDDEEGEETITCRYLLSATGYYDYDRGYTPDFPGAENFRGQIVHPQAWHDGIDVSGKKIVVIGSGATAVTLVPALAEAGAEVTMLQRSPSYVASLPSRDPVSAFLRRRLPPKIAHGMLRSKNVLMSIAIYNFCRRAPERAKAWLIGAAEKKLGDAVPVDPHFTPAYGPWDQRLCLVPDDDLFEVLREGKAEIVTAPIARFTPSGIELEGGETLKADIVVTATGLRLLALGGMKVTLDGTPLVLSESYNYKGMMLSDVPNFAVLIGYTNASWTLKIDLACRYFCRLIEAAQRRGAPVFVPRYGEEEPEGERLIDFSSGYVLRDIDSFPKQGPKRPWRNHQNYVADALDTRFSRIDDGVMRFERPMRDKALAS